MGIDILHMPKCFIEVYNIVIQTIDTTGIDILHMPKCFIEVSNIVIQTIEN